jgi:hypothetical protein
VPTDSEELDADGRQFLNEVFAQIRARTGRDFGMYKTSTLLRRISRRMQFNQTAVMIQDLTGQRRARAEL